MKKISEPGMARIVVQAFVAGTVVAAWAGPAGAANPATHVVTDMSGTSVTVPITINRIAEQFPAHTITDIMLNVGDKLVAIPQNVKTIPLLKKIYPRISTIPELFRGSSVNMEDLLACNPDVISIGVVMKPFEATGIPSVVMSFDTFARLQQSLVLAGTLYGDAAAKRAAVYNKYLDGKLSLIKSRLANLPDHQRSTVVHIASYPPLVIDGGHSIMDEWIRIGGGTDAASEVNGPHVGISIEQLLQWNPEVLIIETPGGDQGLAAHPGLSVIAALSKAPGW